MRVTGISFSGRKKGNCDHCLAHCPDTFVPGRLHAAAVHIHEHPHTSRDYHKRSIDGDMIEAEPVRQRLDRFMHSILDYI